MRPSILLLDADGVVNTAKLFDLSVDHGIAIEVLQPFFQGPFQDCLVGKADLRDVIAQYLAEWGWKGTVDDLLAYWFEQGHLIHEKVRDTVLRLRAAGVPVHLGTNQEKHRMDYMRTAMGYGGLFDGIHASYDVGEKKPDIAYFSKVNERLGSPDPASVVFWDDLEKNVAAANEFGLRAEVFRDEDEFARKTMEWFA